MPTNDGSKKKGFTVYVPDVPKFNRLRDSIRVAWYEHFGSSLLKGDLLIKSLQYTLDSLTGKDVKGGTIYDLARDLPVTFKYGRLSK